MTMDKIRHVFFFDIDGTLLSTGGAGRRAMERAFEAVHGVRRALEGISLGGMTDPAIYNKVQSVKGFRPDMAAFRSTYLDFLREELPRFNGRGTVLPGVMPLMEVLSARPDCLLGLLTGNWEDGAALKLSFYRLRPFFHFGAFGDDAEDRRELPPHARARAIERFGKRMDDATRFYVVGDTPRDIDCALFSDCTAVAVATGEYSEDELAPHEPHHLFSSLEDTSTVLLELGLSESDGDAYPNCDSFLRLSQS